MKTDIKSILDLAEKIIQTAKIVVAQDAKTQVKKKKGAKKAHVGKK
jgi:hypothetical protein